MIAPILFDMKVMKVGKSENDKGLIETLRVNRKARQILGLRNMETLIRRFQVEVNGDFRTICIAPKQVKWFWWNTLEQFRNINE